MTGWLSPLRVMLAVAGACLGSLVGQVGRSVFAGHGVGYAFGHEGTCDRQPTGFLTCRANYVRGQTMPVRDIRQFVDAAGMDWSARPRTASATTLEHHAGSRTHLLQRQVLRRALVSAAPLLLVVWYACGSGTDAYIRGNEALLASLPVLPGAQETDRQSAPYRRPNCEEPLICRGGGGVNTTVTYRAPQGTTAKQVVDFYASRLQPQWTGDVPAIQAGASRAEYEDVFSMGAARVTVFTNFVGGNTSEHQFSVSVDYRAVR